MAKNANATLIPLGVGLILGSLSLFPSTLEKYLVARSKATEASLRADALYDGWFGQTTLQNFYNDELGKAIDDLMKGKVEQADRPLPKDVKQSAAMSAARLDVPGEQIERNLVDLRKTIRSKVEKAMNGSNFESAIDDMRRESQIDPATYFTQAREADVAISLARAAQKDRLTAWWFCFVNCIFLVATIGAGVAMLWSAMKGDFDTSDENQSVVTIQPSDAVEAAEA